MIDLLDPRALIVGIAVVGVLVALPLFVAAVRRLRRLRLVGGTLFLLTGSLVALLLAGMGLVATNLLTYERLTHEQDAALVTTRRLAERHFAVTVQEPGVAPRHFELRGDEWQIDARVLKWRALGTIVGLDTLYRLERISGRYGDLVQEQKAQRTVHGLAADPGLDFWSVVRRHPRFVPLADALYGSAAYVPMAEGAEYKITVSANGLVVRPANDAARKALNGWK